MLTYKQFVRAAQAKQRAYIRDERRRMAKAEKLLDRYQSGMTALGLHPLNRMEVGDRKRELHRMERDIPDTHGDSPTMRWAYGNQGEAI